jgi:VanZ family protein
MKFLKIIYKPLFWFGVILVVLVSLIPIAGSLNRVKIGAGSFNFQLDHVLHVIGYFSFFLYYLIGSRKSLQLFERKPFFKLILIMLVVSVSTEVLQLFIPARRFTGADLVSNMAGVLLGTSMIIIADICSKTQKSKESKIE